MSDYRLIFIHGAGDTGAVWSEQMMDFPHAEAVTLPGHFPNETAGNSGYNSVEAYTEWLHQYLVAERNVDHKRGPVVLVGHSMGGAIAMTYCLKYPGELAALVLVSTGSRLRVAPAILEGLGQDYPATVAVIVDMVAGPGVSEQRKRAHREAMEELAPRVVLGDFEACNKFEVGSELFRLGSQPVLVVVGDQDRMTPPKYAKFLVENIPGADLIVIPQAGHNVMAEQPEIFNLTLHEFLKRSLSQKD